MKIHVIMPGFTPEVYEGVMPTFVKQGVDKIVAVHSAFGDKSDREKVENTLLQVAKLTGQQIDERTAEGETFEDYIRYFIKLFQEFSQTDQIFIHLGGGERFLGVAAIYASFFVNRNIRAISTLEIKKKGKVEFTYDTLPSLPLYKLGDTKRDILRVLKSHPNSTLTEVQEKLKGVSKPAVYTHLKGLIGYGFIDMNEKERKYRISPTGALILEKE